MQDLKNLNCLLPKTKKLLLQLIDSCDFLEKYVLLDGVKVTFFNANWSFLKPSKIDRFNIELLLNLSLL